jgi:hypothetical protein
LYRASSEPDPLGRAEHLVYLSAFFNKEAQAIEYFNGVKQRYNAAKVPGAEKPVVAWMQYDEDISLYGYMDADGKPIAGAAAMFSFTRYKTLLTVDAGAGTIAESAVTAVPGVVPSGNDYVLPVSAFPDEGAWSEAVQGVLKTVDILIDETFQLDPNAVTLVRLCSQCLDALMTS